MRNNKRAGLFRPDFQLGRIVDEIQSINRDGIQTQVHQLFFRHRVLLSVRVSLTLQRHVGRVGPNQIVVDITVVFVLPRYALGAFLILHEPDPRRKADFRRSGRRAVSCRGDDRFRLDNGRRLNFPACGHDGPRRSVAPFQSFNTNSLLLLLPDFCRRALGGRGRSGRNSRGRRRCRRCCR